MTPLRQRAIIRQVKHISISSVLTISLLGSPMLQSCSSSGNNDDGSYEEVEVYEKGVRMYISETEKGVYKITEEIPVQTDSSVAIIKGLDGKEFRLSPEAAKKMIDAEIVANPDKMGQSASLSNALMYGGMGYLLARTVSPNYSSYRPDMNNNVYPGDKNRSDTTRRRRSGFFGMFYMTSRIFNQSTGVRNSIETSRAVHTRPAGGRSGFFGGRVRSTFGG